MYATVYVFQNRIQDSCDGLSSVEKKENVSMHTF